MGNRREYLVNSIVRYCSRLDQKGFGANHDGNISLKYEGNLLATPTSASKGDIVPEMIITLDMDGKKIDGIGKPFSEIQLHLAAYRSRPDISAVVHAHPPYATARGLVNEALRPSLPEAIVSIGGNIPVVPYAMPGAPENNELIANALAETDVLMLQGNGVLSVGSDIEQAYLRLELVEHLAKIDCYAKQMGKGFSLPENDLNKLLEKRASIGLGPKGRIPDRTAKNEDNQLKNIIAEEIRKALQG